MVEGRSNRKFADELKVVEAMKSAGYDESLLYERKLITLTQMEKDFGKKAVAETLGELIVKLRVSLLWLLQRTSVLNSSPKNSFSLSSISKEVSL